MKKQLQQNNCVSNKKYKVTMQQYTNKFDLHQSNKRMA